MLILVTDGMDKTALAALKEKGHEVVEQFYAPEELGAALRDFDAVVVRSKTKVRAPHIDAALGGKLKLIIRGGVGVDNIDVKYAEEKGIKVMNTPRASSHTVKKNGMERKPPSESRPVPFSSYQNEAKGMLRASARRSSRSSRFCTTCTTSTGS